MGVGTLWRRSQDGTISFCQLRRQQHHGSEEERSAQLAGRHHHPHPHLSRATRTTSGNLRLFAAKLVVGKSTKIGVFFLGSRMAGDDHRPFRHQVRSQQNRSHYSGGYGLREECAMPRTPILNTTFS